MGHFTFGWTQGMDPVVASSLSDPVPLPSAQSATTVTNGAGTSYCIDLSMCTPALPVVLPSVAQAEAARRRREEEENNTIHLVNLLVMCACWTSPNTPSAIR
jgi:hypothetical protein